MALNIKDNETDALARTLANTTGESLTVAIRTALSERLTRVQRQGALQARRRDLARYIERGRARATLDARPVDEILGYDEHGLPS